MRSFKTWRIVTFDFLRHPNTLTHSDACLHSIRAHSALEAFYLLARCALVVECIKITAAIEISRTSAVCMSYCTVFSTMWWCCVPVRAFVKLLCLRAASPATSVFQHISPHHLARSALSDHVSSSCCFMVVEQSASMHSNCNH